MKTKRKHPDRDRDRAKHKNDNVATKKGFGENSPSSEDTESVNSSKHSAQTTVLKTASETVSAGGKRDKSGPSPVPGPSTGRGRGRSKSKSPSRSRSSSVSRKRNRRSRSRSRKRKRRSSKSKHRTSKSHRRHRSRSSSRSWSSSSHRGLRMSRDRHPRSRSRSNSRSSSPERRRKLSPCEAVEDFLEKNKRAAMFSRSSNDTNRNNSSLHNNSSLFNSTKIKQEENMIFHEKLMLQASGKWTEEMEHRWKLNENEIKELKIFTSRKISQLKENAEDHPEYDTEWAKFWKAKYIEVQDLGKDPDKYDYTCEWKTFWLMLNEKRLLEEHDVKLKEVRRKHGMDLDTISSLNCIANKLAAPMSAQRICFGVAPPPPFPPPPAPNTNFRPVFLPGHCPFPPPFIRSRSGRPPLLQTPVVFTPYFPPHPFPVPGNSVTTFRHGFHPVQISIPVPPPQPVPAPANVNLTRAYPPVPVPVPRPPELGTTATTANQLKPNVNTAATNCSPQKVKISDEVSSTPRQLDPLRDPLCNSTESNCNTANPNPPKVTVDDFNSTWRSLTGQNLLDAAKSAVEASTKSEVSIQPHKDDNIYDGLSVVQVLNLMLGLEDHLSFLSLKVQEYLNKAEKAERIKLGKSYSMLKDKEFTTLLLKCRDKFFTIYRAKVCSSSVMKKLNFAIFAMGALIDSYNCEKPAQAPATSPTKNTEAMKTISSASAESRSSRSETVEEEKEFIIKGVNSASTVELTPEKLIPASILPLRPKSPKQNGFHSTSLLDPKPSPADLPSGSSRNGNQIIENNPIAARIVHIPQEIKEEISSIIADFLIAQGKDTLTESELFSHLLSIFEPVMKVEDSEVVVVKVEIP